MASIEPQPQATGDGSSGGSDKTSPKSNRANGDSGLEEPEDFKTPQLSPPPPAKKPGKAASRRSMLNITRRQSKSMVGGIPFEDQVAAMTAAAGQDASSSSVEDRLRGLVRMSLSATLRGMQDALREEDADDAEADAAATVSSHLRRATADGLSQEALESIRERVTGLAGRGGGDAARANESMLLPSRVRCVRKCTADLTRETAAWKQLLAARKADYQRAKRDRKAAQSGERQVGEESDLTEEMRTDPALHFGQARDRRARLRRQEEELRACAALLERRRRAARKRLGEADAEMTAFARVVAARSQRGNDDETDAAAENSAGKVVVLGENVAIS